MRLALLLLFVASFAACKDKPKDPPRVAPAPSARAPAVVEAPAEPAAPAAPAPDAAAPVDAADPIDAPPTPSQRALAVRAEFFSKVTKASKRGAGNCGALLAELEGFAAEARAISQRRAEVTGDEITRDDAMVASSLRALTRITSACPEKDRFDAFFNVLGETPR